MKKPEWILFDCMETIVDVVLMPEVRTYSFWCYDGCGYESLWTSSDNFIEEYVHIRESLRSKHEQYRELNSLDLYRLMVADKLPDQQQAKAAAESILKNFWKNYTKNCYVDDTVKQTLKELSSKYHCGVVSNFTVDGGIEDLLTAHGILTYFDFVVTSVRVGWKKPHPEIYDAAMAYITTPKDKVLFIGDNYDCDYTGPREYGFQSILLDKENRYPLAPDKINAICELPDWLEKRQQGKL